MNAKPPDSYCPIQVIGNAFISQRLQSTGTPRLAVIFEICKSAGTQDQVKSTAMQTHMEATWFQPYVSPRDDVRPFERSRASSPNYFVNHAVAGRKLAPNDPFYTRSHLGVCQEAAPKAIQKCVSVFFNGYRILPPPTQQGDMSFSIYGNLAKLLAYFHQPFDTSLQYNPLEGPVVEGLARHAIISRDFGFVYEMLKLIDDRLDVSKSIRLRAEIGPIVSTIMDNLNQKWKPGDPDRKMWLVRTIASLKEKEDDFESRGESTRANDLIQLRCMMLVDANLIDTSTYGNWAFSRFGDAYAYFEKVHAAIHKFASIPDNAIRRWLRSNFTRDPQLIIPLAWNHCLDEIETNRNPGTDEDCRRALISILAKMSETGIKRIRLIELFSAINILNQDKHFKPYQVYQVLQTMLREQLFRAIEKNHGDPLLTRPNRRKLTMIEDE